MPKTKKTKKPAPLTIPGAHERKEAAVKAPWNAWRDAAAEFASASANVAAAMVRELWPTAETIVFDVDQDEDAGWISTFLLVRDTDGAIIWYNPHTHPGDIDDEAALTLPRPAELEDETLTSIEQALADAQAADEDFFPHTNDGVSGHDRMREMSVTVAVDEYVPADEKISFEVLARLLERETSVLNPADVPGLVAMLRLEANRPPTVWAWPQHNTEGGTWCRWSGVTAGSLESWAGDGNTCCPANCPGSEVQPTN